MSENVGSISYDARIDTKQFMTDATLVEKTASNVAKNGSSSFNNFSKNASSAFGNVADSISSMANIAVGALITGSVGLASFISQASELQGITASFESMTGSVELARDVLNQLYDFSFKTAFSTSDINNAARSWLGAGLSVDDLGKIMSEVGDIAGATGANLGQLTLPLTQAMARGKLQTQDYYQILNSGAGAFAKVLQKEVTERGLGNLQDALAAGTISTEVMFSALEKANATGGFAFDGALKQSKTFTGQMSNLMETVGNVGLEILGVNKATGEIDPNGVFAQLSTTVSDATKWLNKNKKAIKDVASFLIDNAIPAITGLAVAFGVAKVAAVIFNIAAMGKMEIIFNIVATAIMAIITALTFLQVKFNIFGKAWEMVKDTWGNAQSFFENVWSNIQDIFSNVSQWFTDRFNEAIDGITTAFKTFKDGVKSILDNVKSWINDNKQAIINWSIVIGTLLLPKFTAMSIEAIKSLSLIIAKFAVTSAVSIIEAAKATLAWVVGASQTSFAWVTQTLPAIIAGFVSTAVQSVISAAKVVAGWIIGAATTLSSWAVTFAGMVAGFVMVGVQALISAGKVALAWLLAMGPVGLIIAAIMGISALIIANWSTVSKWLSDFWTWFGKVGIDAWNGLKQVFSKVGEFFGGVFNTVKNIFTTIGSTVGNAIGDAFKNAINGVLSFAVGLINGFIDGINTVISIINKIPGVDIGKLGKLPVPQLATGGIISSPTLAMIGEGRESEAVIPLSKLDSMINGDGGGITINVDMSGIMTSSPSDERTIAKRLVDRINEELRSKGKTQIGIA